ncbi:hypothetical protein HC928_09270 [bacterium]|nr:hypothetical protein [bacterium]
MKLLIVSVLVVGVFFRVFQLDEKFYWGDEMATSLRSSGYTQNQVVEEAYDGRILSVEDLQKYYIPTNGRNFLDAMKAFSGNPEHPPLYFILARWWTQFWMQWFDNHAAVIRSLSVLLNLLVIPCMYWLAWELFESETVAWVAVAIAAILPLNVVYSHEARQYSLWALSIASSSAALLGALRRQTTARWRIYWATLTVGLYTHLLSFAVVAGHGLYLLLNYLSERVQSSEKSGLEDRQFRKTALAYGRSVLWGVIAFSPWAIAILHNFFAVEATLESVVEDDTSPSYLINKWSRNLNYVFFNGDLASVNFILLLVALYSVYVLCRHTPRRSWLFLLTLIGMTTLPLIIPDLLFGGTRSTRLRYLYPLYISIQLSLAYLFTPIKIWGQTVWRSVVVAIVAGGIIGQIVGLQTGFLWGKGNKVEFYLEAAEEINQSPNPLIVTDTKPIRVLVLSRELTTNAKFQLTQGGNVPEPLEIFSDIYVFNASEALKQAVAQQQGIDMTQLEFLIDDEKLQLLRSPRNSI